SAAAPSAAGSPSAAATAPGTAAPSASGTVSAGPSAGSGPARLDDVRGGHPAAPAGSAVIGPTEGHDGPTLVLHGDGGSYAATAGPVVDTSRSFTVSAMVRNNAPTGGRAVVTQGSGSYYSFYLGRDYWGTHNQWVFKVQTAAGGEDNTTYQAFSTGQATTGQWTLLTGVYDASTRRIQLYVDGTLAQTTAVKGIWQTSGPLEFGRTRYKGAWSDFWDGAIADVQVWNQALPAARVSQLRNSRGASAGTAPAAGWLLP
ncbi:LamG domain-containing protein, partial [Kitasatospora paranensis]